MHSAEPVDVLEAIVNPVSPRAVPPTPKPSPAPSPPESSAMNTEERLLDLLQQHLAGTERAIGDLREGMARLSDKFEAASNRLFILALLLVIAVVATSGANLFISYRQGAGVAVGTGDAAVTTSPPSEADAP